MTTEYAYFAEKRGSSTMRGVHLSAVASLRLDAHSSQRGGNTVGDESVSMLSLRAVVESVRDFVWLVDARGRLVVCSDALRAYFANRFGVDMVPGVSSADILPPERAAQFDEFYARAAKEGAVQTTWQLDDGRAMRVALYSIVENGTLAGIAAYAHDDTLRTKAEEALRRSEALFRAVVENSQDGVVFTDAAGQVTFLSPSHARIHGFSAQERIGRSGFEHIHPDDVARGRAFWADIVARPGQAATIEYRAHHKDGSWRHVESTVQNLLALPSVGAMVIVSRDLTERKKMTDSLAESEARFRQLATHISEVFWLTSVDKSEVLYVSPGYTAIWGRPCESLYQVGKDWMEAIHPLDRERIVLAAANQREGAYDERYRIVRPDGAVRWIRDRAFPVTDAKGNVVRIAGISSDVTAEVEAEQRSTAAHEALHALTQRLMTTEERVRHHIADVLHDEVQQLLVAVRLKVEHLASTRRVEDVKTVTDLLEQCLASTRTLATELRPTTLGAGRLDKALEWLADWMQTNLGIAVELDVAFGDAAFPRDVGETMFTSVRELLLNVVKHARVDRARVEGRIAGDHLEVTVLDEGIGSDALDHAHTLGHALVRERLATLGGHLEIASRAGGGFRAHISVPLAESPAATTVSARAESLRAASDAGSPKKKPHGNRCRVLIVDDHALVREGLRERLHRESGIVVVGEAANGALGVDAVRTLGPDVVLMDVGMPVLDGIEATKRITAEHPHVRVIGLSMYGDEAAARMKAAGAVHHLSKGVGADELVSAILGGADTGAPAQDRQ